MANLTLTGAVETDKFAANSDNKERTIYGKLEVSLDKQEKKATIPASEIGAGNLNDLGLLLVRGKNDKYDFNVKFSLNLDNETITDEKLKSSRLIWLNLDKKFNFLKDKKIGIKSLDFEINNEDDEDDKKPAGPAVIEILVLRRINTSSPPTSSTSSDGSNPLTHQSGAKGGDYDTGRESSE
jgi:hypothetical protein